MAMKKTADRPARKPAACPTDSAVKAVDRIIAKCRAMSSTPELDAMVKHLVAARAAGACPAPRTRKPSTLAEHIEDARADIAKLARWPNGPKMAGARHRLKLHLMMVVRPLIENGYGTPARPLAPALARGAGLTLAEARGVVDNMLRAGCLNYPKGSRGPMLDEGSC